VPVRVKRPECGQSVQAPSRYQGKKIKCPGCKEPFVVPSAPSSGSPSSEPKQQSLPPVPPPPVPPLLPPKDFESSSSDDPAKAEGRVDMVACPFCAESIKAAAKKCKHCGEFLDGQSPTPPTHASTVSNEFREETEQEELRKKRSSIPKVILYSSSGSLVLFLLIIFFVGSDDDASDAIPGFLIISLISVNIAFTFGLAALVDKHSREPPKQFKNPSNGYVEKVSPTVWFWVPAIRPNILRC